MKYFIKVLCLIFLFGCSQTAPRQPRLSLAEDFDPKYFFRDIDGIQGTYSFGYSITDPVTGNIQSREEERYPNGTVAGSYGYIDAMGSPQNYRYIADEKGYRVFQDKPFKTTTYRTDIVRIPDHTNPPSITWTRPKKVNKKKPGNILLNKLPVHKRPQEFNLIGPPSSYVEY